MAEVHGTARALTLVAIDIAKDCHDVLIEPPAPAWRRRFRTTNSAEDFERLSNYLREEAAAMLIGLEATGNYHPSAG
jgi:transposase